MEVPVTSGRSGNADSNELQEVFLFLNNLKLSLRSK